MTIRASQSNSRPLIPSGSKAPVPVPADEPLIERARDVRRDRLQLSAQTVQVTEKTADDLNAAELEKIRSAVQSTTPEVKTPEATQPETKAETAKTESTTTESTTTRTTQAETGASTDTAKDAATSQSHGQTTEQKVEAPKKLLFNHAPYYTQKDHLKQREALIESALAGQTVSYQNFLGASVDVAITKGANTADGYEQYQVKVAGGSFAVTVAPGQSPKELLTKLVEYYSRFPEHMRGNLKSIALETRHNPEDAYWAKVYGKTEFASAATAGSGAISFWNLNGNPLNLSEDTFNHEMGHLVGEAQKVKGAEHATRVPAGWQEAAKADNDQVSNYSGMNPDEDFAETWSYYLYSRTDAKAMEALRERVPNRVKILDELYEKAEGKAAPPPATEAPKKPEGNGNG